jgi:glycosyltransferase involved in cell wall biosynthesis
LRLGVYSDLVYRLDAEGVVSTDLSFIRFPTSLPPRVDEVVVLGRRDPVPGRGPYPLPSARVRFVGLPYYPSVFHVGRMLQTLRGSCRVFARELERLDAVWLFGPNPLAVLFALIARRRGTPVFLGVRQDYPRYIGNRLPSRRWAWALGAAWGLELAFRLLARRSPTIAVGEELAGHYRGGRAPVLATGLSLIGADDVVGEEEALARSWDGDELRLLSVGRLDPEKNPLLLAAILERLRARDPRWRLTVVGVGPLAEELERHAGPGLELAGYVENGPPLWRLYRESHAFLHVSLTEGVPQVVFEAFAAGIPIVATDVGGVSRAVERAALLVPPEDAEAAAAALERLRDDGELRARLVRDGLAIARRETTEAQLDRVLEFISRAG